MVVNSAWDVQYNSKHYRCSRDVNDLAYKVDTLEGINFEFMPTTKGLHVLDCSSYFQPGNKNHGYIFRNNITNNNTKGGFNMMRKELDDQFHNNTGDRKDMTNIIPDDGIDTIEKSEKRFSVKDRKKAHRTR